MNLPTRMRAVQFARHGRGPEVHEVVDHAPVPIPAADEVLVQIHYGALHRLDDWVRIGWPGIGLPLPHIPGSDCSGEIVAQGKSVSGWSAGQRVTANSALWCGRCPACAQGRHLFMRHLAIWGSTMGTQADYRAVMQPVIDSVVSPRHYADAIWRMQRDRHFGKIVVDLQAWE